MWVGGVKKYLISVDNLPKPLLFKDFCLLKPCGWVCKVQESALGSVRSVQCSSLANSYGVQSTEKYLFNLFFADSGLWELWFAGLLPLQSSISCTLHTALHTPRFPHEPSVSDASEWIIYVFSEAFSHHCSRRSS